MKKINEWVLNWHIQKVKSHFERIERTEFINNDHLVIYLKISDLMELKEQKKLSTADISKQLVVFINR